MLERDTHTHVGNQTQMCSKNDSISIIKKGHRRQRRHLFFITHSCYFWLPDRSTISFGLGLRPSAFFFLFGPILAYLAPDKLPISGGAANAVLERWVWKRPFEEIVTESKHSPLWVTSPTNPEWKSKRERGTEKELRRRRSTLKSAWTLRDCSPAYMRRRKIK